ncbi:MAG: DUF3795 domain-containing protein [Bacteroidales bacterium]|nr:DUF3795 domain-containing protein [Bacteroidales bacterium]
MTGIKPYNLLIAPCGMNCAICLAFLRKKNTCPGCRTYSETKPRYCKECIIVNCSLLKKTGSGFCYECEKYPCKRLKQLDKRYRTKYNMSMLENLANIKQNGLKKFSASEHVRWHCDKCGGTICVHGAYCLTCKEIAKG